MHAAHDHSIGVTFIEVFENFFKCEAGCFTTITKKGQLIVEFIIVESEEVIQVIFPLFGRGT